jgi:hypothetical protein
MVPIQSSNASQSKDNDDDRCYEDDPEKHVAMLYQRYRALSLGLTDNAIMRKGCDPEPIIVRIRTVK